MKYRILSVLALAVALCLSVRAAESSAANSAASAASTQTGKLAVVRLLEVARLPTKDAPDGLQFHFLVTRAPNVTGQFALKEPRDFKVAGQSYQEKTRAALGKTIEPGTEINDVEKFLATHPALRALLPADTKSPVLSIAIAGAKLTEKETAEITLHVGFDKKVEPFTFSVPIPAVAKTH